MNRRFHAVLLAALAGGGLALGQGPAGGSSNPPAPSADDSTFPGPEQLTLDQMLANAAKIVERARERMGQIQRAGRRARASGDMMLEECVAAHRSAAEALSRNASERRIALERHAASGDKGFADHEYTMLTVADEKLSMHSKEASACVGDDLYETGGTTVTAFADPGTPTDDGSSAESAGDLGLPFIPPPESDSAFVE